MKTWESYLQPASVPVPFRVAAWLNDYTNLDTIRRAQRDTSDQELMDVLIALRKASLLWEGRSSAVGSNSAPSSEVATPSKQAGITTGQAAQRLGITTRAVTQALTDGRLNGRKIGVRWVIQPESLTTYRSH